MNEDKAVYNLEEKRSKKDIVYDILKREIVQNRLKPGQFLVERKLCEWLNSSRTPIREALKELSEQGLVTITTGRGAAVATIKFEDIAEIYDVRAALEGLAVELCTQNIVPAQIQKLEEMQHKYERALAAKNYDAILEVDLEFHMFILEVAANSRLMNLMKNMYDQVHRITNLIKGDETRAVASVEQHKNVLKAIANKNRDQARRFMELHVRDSKEYHLQNCLKHKYE